MTTEKTRQLIEKMNFFKSIGLTGQEALNLCRIQGLI